jgi:hypothetical protein
MMYEATWADDNQTLVYMAFEGVWQPDEFTEAHTTLHDLLSEVGHEVSVVLHLAQPQPIAMEMVAQIKNLVSIDHPNRARMVIVAPDAFLNGVREVVRRAFGGDQPEAVYFAHSLDDVDQVLASE